MYGDQRRYTDGSPVPQPEISGGDDDRGEADGEGFDGARRSAPPPVRTLDLLLAAAAPLVLAVPVLYFGVLRAVETGRALRQSDWHPGSVLPETVAFSDAVGGFAGTLPSNSPGVPLGEALLIVLFCLGMGCFLLSAALRVFTASRRSH